MSRVRRTHRVQVVLSDAERSTLDRVRKPAESEAACLRRGLEALGSPAEETLARVAEITAGRHEVNNG